MSESLPIPFRELGTPPNIPPLLLYFSEVAVKNEIETMAQGAPIFDSAVHVRIVVPGTNGDAPIYEVQRTKPDGTVKVDQAVYHRFREPFEIWKKGQTPAQSGTPLEQWPLMDVAQVATMKATNIFTVQQLAELSDGVIDASKTMSRGGREWREKARAWLAAAKGAAEDVSISAENARLKEEMAALKEQVAELLKKQNTLGYDKPKRGRVRTEPSEGGVVIPDEEELRL